MITVTPITFKKIFRGKRLRTRFRHGFTIVELLVVLFIIGILSIFASLLLQSTRETSYVVAAGRQQRQLIHAVQLYYNDMGFYPPDVNRGWDPGFTQPMPSNPDEDAGETIPGSYASPGTNCAHCPSNWQDVITEHWDGPYLFRWPRYTPWGGKYDYNYWGAGASRYGCTVQPGIYAGIQGDYNNENTIPPSAELKLVNKGFDTDGCLNGESQMLLWPL